MDNLLDVWNCKNCYKNYINYYAHAHANCTFGDVNCDGWAHGYIRQTTNATKAKKLFASRLHNLTPSDSSKNSYDDSIIDCCSEAPVCPPCSTVS